MGRETSDHRSAGYQELLVRFGVEAPPNWHRSQISNGSGRRVEVGADGVVETYPSAYWPGDACGDHLEFALKYDGTNLGLLAALLSRIDAAEITALVRAKPTGKYARRLWYFYEMFTGSRLPLEDLVRGSYVDLLEPDEFVTLDRGRKVRRQRVNDNLLGDVRFCPTVRRTERVGEFIGKDLGARSAQVIAAYSPALLRRALSYLYTRETKSSFAIEQIKPSASRTERFVSLLQAAALEDLLSRSRLIDLQNQIVDPRFRDQDYRDHQNYIGRSVDWQNEHVHYVCPKPDQVEDLMGGLIELHDRVEQGGVHPVVHAALVGYGFVFVHPFEDGNGRIHRLLIHSILSRRGFVPAGVIFPVSAVMLRQSAEYDASLEAFSRPLVGLTDYTLDAEGRMTVHNDMSVWYRYPDMTAQVEHLFSFIEQTIDTELTQQLAFLARYDAVKQAMQEVVDMPDRDIDLFMRFCLQNNGKLSQRKRASHFAALTDQEVRRLEEAVARDDRE